MIGEVGKNNKRKLFDRYLPFIAKSPKMKLRWLKGAFTKGVLSSDEITPYVRLLLAASSVEEKEQVKNLFRELDENLQLRLLEAADIYDAPKLFRLCINPVLEHAEIILTKNVPPYEKRKQMILDTVFYAINDFSKELLADAVSKLIEKETVDVDFLENYKRFQEILEDKEFLLSLYPNAAGDLVGGGIEKKAHHLDIK